MPPDGSQRLWTTVDCACGKRPPRVRDSISEIKDKSLISREADVDILINAMSLLAARVDGLEYRLDQILGIIDAPLSPAEAIERLRQLRIELRDA